MASASAPAEHETGLATMLNVADPHAVSQLTKGFYNVEANSWRWTAGQFSATLRPPKTGPKNGATLLLKFTLPDVILAKLQHVTVSAKVNGVALPPETYIKAGDMTYSKDVPASALQTQSVPVDFALDRALPPSGGDLRELGIIVSTIGFEAK